MINIAFDYGGAVQLNAICVDDPLDHSTDGQLLRDYVAFHFRAFVNQNGDRPQLTLDPAEHMYYALADNFADDRRAATDRGRLVF